MAKRTVKKSKRNVRKISLKDAKKIEKLKTRGFDFYLISDKMGVSTTTVRYWYNKSKEPEKFERDKEIRRTYFTRWYNERKDNPEFKKKIRENNIKAREKNNKLK